MSFDGFCVEIRFLLLSIFPFFHSESKKYCNEQQRAKRMLFPLNKGTKRRAFLAPDCFSFGPQILPAVRRKQILTTAPEKNSFIILLWRMKQNSFPFHEKRHHLLCLCSLLVDAFHVRLSTSGTAEFSQGWVHKKSRVFQAEHRFSSCLSKAEEIFLFICIEKCSPPEEYESTFAIAWSGDARRRNPSFDEQLNSQNCISFNGKYLLNKS